MVLLVHKFPVAIIYVYSKWCIQQWNTHAALVYAVLTHSRTHARFFRANETLYFRFKVGFFTFKLRIDDEDEKISLSFCLLL